MAFLSSPLLREPQYGRDMLPGTPNTWLTDPDHARIGMDAYTARWYVWWESHCYTAPKSLTNIKSLQVSSSSSTPFNTYRQYRIPNHLNRSRFPIHTPGVKGRTMPAMPPDPELWNPPASIYTGYRPSKPLHAVEQAMPVHPQRHVQSMDTCHAATRSADIEASYFQPCLTSDHTFVSEKWDNCK